MNLNVKKTFKPQANSSPVSPNVCLATSIHNKQKLISSNLTGTRLTAQVEIILFKKNTFMYFYLCLAFFLFSLLPLFLIFICILLQPRARFSAPVQTDPGAHPASCTMGTGSFPGVKRPGCGADHPPPSKCRGRERVGLYLYSLSGPSWPVMGTPYSSPPSIGRYLLYSYNTNVIMLCSAHPTRLVVGA